MSEQEIHELLRDVMLRKSPITAVYKEQHRLLCPVILGLNKNSRLQVLCYQFGGKSSSGLEPGNSPANWRCIPVARLSSVEIIDLPWVSGPKHSSVQTCIEYIELDAEDPSKNGTRRLAAKAMP
jgi:hypothetical protein